MSASAAPAAQFAPPWLERLRQTARTLAPASLHGVRLWASVCLALYIAFCLELDNPFWAGITAAIVCRPQLGASLRKGWFRLVGTLTGAVAIVTLTACFPQDRVAFLLGLALWMAACAMASTLLRNIPFDAALVPAVTAGIVAFDTLGPTGGASDAVFMFAVTRASEISIGIVSAGIVLALTDFGGVPLQLAARMATLTANMTARFTGALALAGSRFSELQEVRGEFVRQVMALDPIVDQAYGESAELRYNSPRLQKAIEGLFVATANWRATAVLLAQSPPEDARQWTEEVLELIPDEFRHVVPARWSSDPAGLRRSCRVATRQLLDMPADTPALRLLADKTAAVFIGIAAALDAQTLLLGVPDHGAARRRARMRLRTADWLPAVVIAVRVFLTVSTVEVFWVLTQWPSGALAIAFSAIGTILFTVQPYQSYRMAIGFVAGTIAAACLAATIKFAVLPQVQSFPAFCAGIGLVLIPAGAGSVLRWQPAAFTATAFWFMPILSPLNQMVYDPSQLYNTALAIFVGLSATALSFSLIPPPSAELRTRRLLKLTLRDLRHLAAQPHRWTLEDWNAAGYAKVIAFPDAANLVQRSRLLAALFMGAEIIRLARAARQFGLDATLHGALAALSQGDVTAAKAAFSALDAVLVLQGTPALAARARVLAISQALVQHAGYFEEQTS